MKEVDFRAALAAVFKGELRYLLRDRMALFLMLGMPVLVYPALFWGMGALRQANEVRQVEKVLEVAAPAGLASWLEEGDALRLVDVGTEDADASVLLPEDPAEPALVRFRSDRRDSRTARDRLDTVLSRRQEALQVEAWKEAGLAVRPEKLLEVDWEDVATATARTGHGLGRFLPLMLVFLAMSGGLYTALDLISGEKERGTLETLFTTRVPRPAILRAKFLVILLMTGAISTIAVLVMWGCVQSGLFTLPMEEQGLRLPLETALLALLLMVPLVVELAALMAVAASYAPDFRSGQAIALPFMLLVLAPAGITAIPGQELGWAIGILPISGVALALRDALAGELDWILGCWTFAWAGVHAFLSLWVAERLVGRESVLLGGSNARARHARGRYGAEAMALFGVVMLLFWFLGQLAQTRDLLWGLVFTQLVLVAAPALAAIGVLARPWKDTLRLRAPSGKDLLLGLVAGIAAPGVGQTVALLQDAILPVPDRFLTQFAESLQLDVSLPVILIVFALLPAVCEELLFRGTILGLMEKSLSPTMRAIVVGVLFGLLHLALFRILPTGVLGIVLSFAALRSGSIFVPMLMHLLNNGLLMGLSETGVIGDEPPPLWAAALLGAVCIGAVALMGRGGTKDSGASG